MSQKCEVCGKIPSFGHNVSHSNKKTAKTWGVNIQKVRVKTAGGAGHMHVCTKCLKAGKVVKA